MNPEMLTAVAAIVVAVGSLVGSIFSNNKTLALLSQRLDQIERKVGEHNHHDGRIIALEEQVKTLFKEVAEAKAELARKG